MEPRTDHGTPDGGGDVAESIRPLLATEQAVFSGRLRGLVAFVFALAAVQTIRSDEAYLWLGVLTAGALTLVVPVMEWRLGTDRLVLSLPVRRATVVRARYVMAGMAAIGGWATWLVAGHLLAPILAPDRPGPAWWATLPGHLAFFSLTATLLATFLPLHFRFGLGRATVAVFPVLLALYLLGLGLAPASGAVGPPLVPPGALARSTAELLVQRAGAFGAVSLVALGLAAMIAGSMALSTRGFRRRDV